jgi:translation initiation factor IF-3
MHNSRAYDRRYNKNDSQQRINFGIRALTVRVIHESKQLGIMPIDQARKLAQEAGLDLVEIVSHSNPPVCEIKDFGKWKFEEKIKAKENARKQRESQTVLKEIRLRPTITDHDVDTKVAQAKRFIEEGKKVQFNLQFKGHREMANRDNGFLVMNKVIAALAEFGVVEKTPKMEGNRIICCISPKM